MLGHCYQIVATVELRKSRKWGMEIYKIEIYDNKTMLRNTKSNHFAVQRLLCILKHLKVMIKSCPDLRSKIYRVHGSLSCFLYWWYKIN